MDKRIARVIELIDADPALTPETLERATNLSGGHLRRVFRAEMSVTLSEYLKDRRLKHAQHLLERTFLSVKQIAAISGFKDCCHFVKVFHEKLGTPPGHWRANVWKRQ